VARNPRYQLDQHIPELSDEQLVTTYNNFYEFGSHKQIWKAAQALQVRPWTVTLGGMVEQEQTLDVDDLLRKMPLEERVYRHRCVEAWSMAVPWSGFPLRALVELARPLGSARYLRIETFLDPETASGQKQFWYPWPYVEGLTMAEATHELAFIASGLYGKPIAPQNGAPLRLAVPWKYGFKSIKSIVRFTFTDQGHRVRLLGERQPRGAASALEPGRGDAARQLNQGADRAVQRLRRVRGRPVQGAGERAALHVMRLSSPACFRSNRG
jgi:methionine sulfoxide reductase catalytic subunit